MKPRPDKKNTYKTLEEFSQACSLNNLEYVVKSGDPLGIYPPTEKIENTVIGVSGYSGPIASIPQPSGNVYLVRSFRDDRKDGHLNVTDRVFWGDKEGNTWFNYDREYEGHTQEYIDGSGLGSLQGYSGFPPQERGSINDLQSAPFDSSQPPY